MAHLLGRVEVTIGCIYSVFFLLQLNLFKAAYVPRLRIKPFVVRFSRVKVAVSGAFTRSSRSDHRVHLKVAVSGAFPTGRSVVGALSSMNVGLLRRATFGVCIRQV